MRLDFVTAITPEAWNAYGRTFVESFNLYFPVKHHLHVYLFDWPADHAMPNLKSGRLHLHRLDEMEDFQRLRNHCQNDPILKRTLGYGYKPIALSHAIQQSETDFVAWLDSDIEFFSPVSDRLIDRIFDPNADLVHLWRKANSSNEGSFYAFNSKTPNGYGLLHDFAGLYVSGEFLQYKNANDNAVLDRLTTIYKAHNASVLDISKGALGLDAFHQSPWAEVAVHYKGPDKRTVSDPGMMIPSRYDTVCQAVRSALDVTKSTKVVEVGTWNGSRAVHMANTLYEAGYKEMTYVGFDIFGDTNLIEDAHEYDYKGYASLEQVQGRLRNYATVMARLGFTFKFTLVPGNTLDTLPDSRPLTEGAGVAFIDGGHSAETSRSDYENLKHIPYVIFDDVMEKPIEGAPEGPALTWRAAEGIKHLHKSADNYLKTGEPICLGIVSRAPWPAPQIRSPIQVRPQESVDVSEQLVFIKENAAALSEWLLPAQAHGRQALFVSAGPTLPKYLDEIRQRQTGGAVIFAVKHAVPLLHKAGIRPDFTVVLDPRPIDGLSTHGKVRTTLFETMEAGDKILFATMTHTSVREYLESRGVRLIGWHALTQSLADNPLLKDSRAVIGGGTCAATRIPMLAYTLGFRRFAFYGYDFFYPEETPQSEVKQPFMHVNVGVDNTKLKTTGELIAAMQDLANWTKWLLNEKLTIEFKGEGAGSMIWKQTAPDYVQLSEYAY